MCLKVCSNKTALELSRLIPPSISRVYSTIPVCTWKFVVDAAVYCFELELSWSFELDTHRKNGNIDSWYLAYTRLWLVHAALVYTWWVVIIELLSSQMSFPIGFVWVLALDTERHTRYTFQDTTILSADHGQLIFPHSSNPSFLVRDNRDNPRCLNSSSS